MTLFSTLLTLFYLFRSFSHISSRSNFYIALLLISFFLTSTYEGTYLDYLLSADFTNIKFNYLQNLRTNWLSGDDIPLLLSGLLFLMTKLSLYKLSKLLFLELFFISLSSITILIKLFSPLLWLPISLSIIFSIFLHFRKISQFYFSGKSIIKETKKFIFNLLNKKNLCILFSVIYLFYALFINSNIGSLGLISSSHILRLLIIFSILFISSFTNYSHKKKIIFGILPITFVYLGLITSSILGNLFIDEISFKPMTLDAMTTIGLLPLIEIISSKYYLINYYENIESFFKIERNLFKYTVNFFLGLISLTYILYVFTQ